MKNFVLFIFTFIALNFSVSAQNVPLIEKLKEVSQLPAYIPQRVNGLTFDGEKFWTAVYQDKGHYATFNPQIQEWKYSDSETHHLAIRKIGKPFDSVSGMVFVGKKLWLSGSYGKSFGVINTENWEVEKLFNQVVRPDLEKTNSQDYASITFDGTNIWIAWHLCEYKLPDSEVQQLLKIDAETGKIIEKFPLPIGSRPDGTHGLTFDGENLWHIKSNKLSKIDLDGNLIAQYKLPDLKRASGLVWNENSLWIIEFNGKLWNLPFASF